MYAARQKRSYPREGLAAVRLGPGTDPPDIFTFISLPLHGFADTQFAKGGGSV